VVSDVATGEPIDDAIVTLSPGGGNRRTGSDGRFEFNNLDERQYDIMAQKTGEYQSNKSSVKAVRGEKRSRIFL
jgi:hypothetical protein